MSDIALGAPSGWGGRLPLGRKLILAVATLLALITLTILLAVILVTRLGSDETRLNDRNVPFATSVDAAALAAKGVANDERGYLMSGDRRYLGEAEARIVQARRGFAAAVQAASTEDERRTVSQAGDSFEAWVVRLQDEFARYGTDRAAAVKASLGETRELRKTYERDLATAQAMAASSLASGNASIADSASTSRNLLLACLLAVLAAGLVIGCWLVRLVGMPVQRLLTAISEMSPADLQAFPAQSRPAAPAAPAVPLTDHERSVLPADAARRDAAVRLVGFLRSEAGEATLDRNGYESEYALVLALAEEGTGDVMARVARHSVPVVVAVHLSGPGTGRIADDFALLGVAPAATEDASLTRFGPDAAIGTLPPLIRQASGHRVLTRLPGDQAWTIGLLDIARL